LNPGDQEPIIAHRGEVLGESRVGRVGREGT